MKLFRMQLDGEAAPAVPPASVRIVQYRPRLYHSWIPAAYAKAFGEEPWSSDWDKFDGFDEGGVLVATEAATDEPVGFAVSFKREGFGYISVVAVVPAFRRRGIASALIATVVGRLRSQGLRTIKIDVHTTNVAATEAYRKAGFGVVDTFDE